MHAEIEILMANWRRSALIMTWVTELDIRCQGSYVVTLLIRCTVLYHLIRKCTPNLLV